MANIIKIKRSTTQNTPVALEQGELAYSELSGDLFIGVTASGIDKIGGQTAMTKLENIEDGATANETDAYLLNRTNHTGLEQTSDIADDAITYPKMQNMGAGNTLLGNTAGPGAQIAELNATDVRGMLNVEDGADVTDAANVDAAGAVMVDDTSTAGMQFVIDEDSMASNSPTKVPTQQSVKSYVDSQTAGGVTYRGLYNAATNTPNLDTPPTVSVGAGDMYLVSDAGDFYGNALVPGDQLIANTDDPTTFTGWDLVHQTINDASEAQKGIVRLATATETNDGTDNSIAIHPAGLEAWTGSENITTLGTITTGVWAGTPIAAAQLPDASETAKGIIEIANQAEVDLGASGILSVTPLYLHQTTFDGGTF